MDSFLALGKRIYDTGNPREAHRLAVFVLRCYRHRGGMRELESFFRQDGTLRQVAESYPYVYEQATRAFFYHRSTFEERARLIREHFLFLLGRVRPEALLELYADGTWRLWGMEIDNEPLRLVLRAEPGQRKEGLAALMLWLGDRPLYQMMLWIARDRGGEMSLFLGAMQGPNMEGALEIIKRVTKRCHAYRTKNLILYATRAFARALGLAHIYAVTNEGYYANNHLRRDRKLKTSFSDFWLEAGGSHTADRRFDELPLLEPRKAMEEISTHKRALYRRRYELLDGLDEAVAGQMGLLLRQG